MKSDRKYPPELIFSILALTLAILAVGTLYVRDLIEDVSPPAYKTVGPSDRETARPQDLETARPSDQKTVRPSEREKSGQVAFYFTCTDCGPVEVFIDGKPAGTLTGPYVGKGPPTCGAGGTLTKKLPAGRYHISAGGSYDTMITVKGGECTVINLKI